MNKKQMETKLQELQQQVDELLKRNNADMPQNQSAEGWLRYFAEQRDKTNMILASVIEQVKALQETVTDMTLGGGESEPYGVQSEEFAELSPADVKILNFIQTQPQQMACAEDVRKYMGYRGNNAACARMKLSILTSAGESSANSSL